MAVTALALVDSLEQLLRADLLAKLNSESSGELAKKSTRSLVSIYENWQRRSVESVPRATRLAEGLTAGPEYVANKTEVDELLRKIENGEDVNPQLSKDVATAYVPSGGGRRKDLDRLLAEWGVHHLHLSSRLDSSGFTERGDLLLFIAFRPSEALVIGVFKHREWTNEKVVEVIVDNWPDVGPMKVAQTAIGLDGPQITAKEHEQIRNAGVTLLQQVGKSVVIPPGQTVRGHAMNVADKAAQISAKFQALRDNPDQLNAVFGQNDRDLSDWRATRRGGSYGFEQASSGRFVEVGVVTS